MKKILIVLTGFLFSGSLVAAPMPDNVYFRAMNDEMQRSLKELRLKNQPNPYLISYWISRKYMLEISADMGSLVRQYNDPLDDGYIQVQAFVSVGSDQQDGLGFMADDRGYYYYRQPKLPSQREVPFSYDSLRQTLWEVTDQAYLQAVDLYKQKQNYKKKKNIQDKLPDVVPAKPAQFVEPIAPFKQPDMEQLSRQVKEISALGKKHPHLEYFEVSLRLSQEDRYSLNSRGSFVQYSQPRKKLAFNAGFRRPDGQMVETYQRFDLRDISTAEMDRIKQEAEKFLEKVDHSREAKPGEAYVGPILLKPQAASYFLMSSLLKDLQNSKPFLLSFADDDDEAGKLYKKRQLRAGTDLITVYDLPQEREFDGFVLERFLPVDGEGVAAKDLTLLQDGYVKEFPLTQRPLTKNHHSNGHALINNMYGPREKLTNVFVETKKPLTDQEMEDKLRARCRELGLAYGYILEQAFDSDMGIERIYTEDGRKERVIDLRWEDIPTARDLRAVLAVGGKRELQQGTLEGPAIVTPSILLQEAELVPVEHKPHRQPFVPRPK